MGQVCEADSIFFFFFFLGDTAEVFVIDWRSFLKSVMNCLHLTSVFRAAVKEEGTRGEREANSLILILTGMKKYCQNFFVLIVVDIHVVTFFLSVTQHDAEFSSPAKRVTIT